MQVRRSPAPSLHWPRLRLMSEGSCGHTSGASSGASRFRSCSPQGTWGPTFPMALGSLRPRWSTGPQGL
eukprot:12138626-Alexandrium_andersonii.AAC.1